MVFPGLNVHQVDVVKQIQGIKTFGGVSYAIQDLTKLEIDNPTAYSEGGDFYPARSDYQLPL